MCLERFYLISYGLPPDLQLVSFVEDSRRCKCADQMPLDNDVVSKIRIDILPDNYPRKP